MTQIRPLPGRSLGTLSSTRHQGMWIDSVNESSASSIIETTVAIHIPGRWQISKYLKAELAEVVTQYIARNVNKASH